MSVKFVVAIVALVIGPLVLGSPLGTRDADTLMPRDTVLANGKSMQYGSLLDDFKWQSSGVLEQGCSSSIDITNCYSLSLTSDTTKELDPGFPKSPRQASNFLTSPAADGTSHTFTWKHYLSSKTGTSSRFFHLMQIFSNGANGPVVTLDAYKGTVAVKDNVRDCTKTKCPSVPIDQWTDRTTEHTMKVTFGSNGKLDYVVKNAKNGETLLVYSVSGQMGTKGTYLKFGTYRAAFSGMMAVNAAVGDYSQS